MGIFQERFTVVWYDIRHSTLRGPSLFSENAFQYSLSVESMENCILTHSSHNVCEKGQRIR